MITSNVIYKVKTGEDGENSMKARMCPHGNKDKMRHEVKRDSATAQFDAIRLLLAITTFLNMRLGVIDISGAYMKRWPIRRYIYVSPPREGHKKRRGHVWKLLKLPYGLTAAGRQWETVIEHWLPNDMGFEQVKGVSQLFSKCYENGSIGMFLAKVTDDLLFASDVTMME